VILERKTLLKQGEKKTGKTPEKKEIAGLKVHVHSSLWVYR